MEELGLNTVLLAVKNEKTEKTEKSGAAEGALFTSAEINGSASP